MRSFLMATVLAFVMAGSSFADDFIVIVYDTSGSMGERMGDRQTRMQVGQDALIEVLSKVPASTKIGILTFDGWVYELGKVDKQSVTSAIRSTRPGGGTPLYEYIRAGATRLLEERQRQNNIGSYKLIVVTDGVANDDNLNQESKRRDGSVVPGVMDDIASRNIAIDAIGLDMPGDHPIKEIIVAKGLGSYMAGDDPTSLTVSLEKAVAEVSFSGGDTGEDAFKVLNDLPDEFFVISIQGLSTFANHPIGEKPPVVVIRADGTALVEQAPGNEPIPEVGEGGSGVGFVLLCVLGGCVAAVILFVIVGSMSNRRY